MSSLDLAGELEYDSEIEKTARKLRKEAEIRKKNSANTPATIEEETPDLSSDSEEEKVQMANRRAMRDIITPPIDQPPLCITYPNLEVNFELRPGLIQLLPKFHRRENEN